METLSLLINETKSGTQLKPCEMPEGKVIDFLKQYEQINDVTSLSKFAKGKMYNHFGKITILNAS
jgi:hypothetical protein